MACYPATILAAWVQEWRKQTVGMAGWIQRSLLAGGCDRRTEGEDSQVLARECLTSYTLESGLHGGGNGAKKEKGE